MSRPIPGDPVTLRNAANSLAGQADELARQRNSSSNARHAALAQWDGSASVAFFGTMAAYGKDVDRAVTALRTLSTAVRTFADDLARHQGEDRGLRRQIADADSDVRVLRSQIRTAADPVEAAQCERDLRAALNRARDGRRRHDDLWARHRRSTTTLRTAIESEAPPELLWQYGARRIGMAKSTITLLTKGRAAVTVLHLERKPNLTIDQATKLSTSADKLQRGMVGSVVANERVGKYTGGAPAKAIEALGPLATAFLVWDAMRPGWKDVRTGGGYTGWRDVGTRTAGLAQMTGVVLVRFPPTRVHGAAAIGAWALWKGGNAHHDNKDFWREFVPVAMNQLEQNAPLPVFLGKAFVNALPKYRPGSGTLDPALERRLKTPAPLRPPPPKYLLKPDWKGVWRPKGPLRAPEPCLREKPTQPVTIPGSDKAWR